MKVQSVSFGAGEIDIADADEEIQDKLQRILSDALASENLLVLAGSGASLAVVDEKGKSVLPSMGDLWKEASGDPKFTEVATSVQYDVTEENIEAFLSKCESAVDFLDSAKAIIVNEFLTRIRKLIFELCNVVDEKTDLDLHETFLRKVARRNPRRTRAKIYTTNYDRCFEYAASKAGFITIDGFSPVLPQKYDPVYFSYDFVKRDDDTNTSDYLPNVFQLLKVHGSIDWMRDDDGVIIKSDKTELPLIIYPHDGKFKQSFELPYLDLISDFQRSLRKNSTTLFVCGFGFNDAHLSNMIEAAVRTNGELKIIVANRTIDDKNDYVAHLQKLIGQNDARITLIEAGFDDFVKTLPYIMVSHTEEELHLERTKNMSKKADENDTSH